MINFDFVDVAIMNNDDLCRELRSKDFLGNPVIESLVERLEQAQEEGQDALFQLEALQSAIEVALKSSRLC